MGTPDPVENLERFDRRVAPDDLDEAPTRSMTLPFERRQKTRQRGVLDDGSEIAVVLPRGTIMRGGDCLVGTRGGTVRVVAADEPVSYVCGSGDGLARAAYHLGNRHVWVELGPGRVSWLQDHVLDSMIVGFGLAVFHAQLPFEPEGGAYSHGHHQHGREDASASHGHVHEYEHGGRQ
ncbi:MAG: urease accessory protein UreE [Gammaproteobacteria bacterium]|nr:urease accessory protein UreE [Gammaproteobacteria bacterium]|tara:strand:+ start:4117 stop:4650 length:534 start_codon:yes stop_codon:yes gene_type:complete